MKIGDVMSRDVDVININGTIQEAARMMKTGDYGALPVESGGKLKGMITDRDIALWVAGEGKDPGTAPVSECMNEGIKYCYEDESLEDVGKNMAEVKLRRFPVLSREKRLVGIVSLGDMSLEEKGGSTTHQTMQRICS